jgi:hypothetical protein
VVFEQRVAQRLAQFHGHIDQTPVALPRFRVEEFLPLLLGQSLLRRTAFLVVALLLVVAPVRETLLDCIRDLREVAEQRFAEFLVKRRANLLIAGGEAQGFDRLLG